MTKHTNAETITLDEHLDELSLCCENIAEALTSVVEKAFTTEFVNAITELDKDVVELYREERRNKRKMRKTIKSELRNLNTLELTEIFDHINQIKQRKSDCT